MRRLIDSPIRSREEGKVTAAELERKAERSSKTGASKTAAKVVERRLPTNVNAKPLGLAEQRARSRWQRPLAAVLAGAMAENQGLLERLRVGVHGPDWNHEELYQATFNELWEATKKQVEALEIFSRVKWSD